MGNSWYQKWCIESKNWRWSWFDWWFKLPPNRWSSSKTNWFNSKRNWRKIANDLKAKIWTRYGTWRLREPRPLTNRSNLRITRSHSTIRCYETCLSTIKRWPWICYSSIILTYQSLWWRIWTNQPSNWCYNQLQAYKPLRWGIQSNYPSTNWCCYCEQFGLTPSSPPSPSFHGTSIETTWSNASMDSWRLVWKRLSKGQLRSRSKYC